MDLRTMYERLGSRFKVDNWWPAESEFEIMIGAILTQQTSWENVEGVIADMKANNLLDVDSLVKVDNDTLEEVIMPAGFYRQKASRIKGLAEYIKVHYDSDPLAILGQPLEEARRELLSIRGIGEETADSMLLFAGHRPKFVAASHVTRILQRTGILDSEDYGEIQRYVESIVPPKPEIYAKFYALLVQLAKTHCKARPVCKGCPLEQECAFSARRGK